MSVSWRESLTSVLDAARESRWRRSLSWVVCVRVVALGVGCLRMRVRSLRMHSHTTAEYTIMQTVVLAR